MVERHGTTRVVRGWGGVHGACQNLAEIRINGKTYLCFQRVDGYRLTARTGESYIVTGAGCTCPDTLHRSPEGGCKHVKALVALIGAGKL